MKKTLITLTSAMCIVAASATMAVAATRAPTSAARSAVTSGIQAGSAPNLIVNGTFDLPVISGNYLGYATGSTAIPGWVIGGSNGSTTNVWIISARYWQPGPGSKQSLQLTGPGPEGSVTQTVATTPGYTYLLQWEMAGDVTVPALVDKMNVLWDGTLVEAPTFKITDQSSTSMGWVHMAIPVKATGPKSTVEFVDATKSGNAHGSVLDTVSLTAQSETVNGFTVTASSGPYSLAERQMLAKIPGHAVVPASGTPVCTLQAAAANQVQDGAGLEIVWGISPSVQFIHGTPTAQQAGAKLVDQYLTGLLNSSKSLYLAALQADRVALQGSNDLASWWAVRVQSTSATGSLMSFQIAKSGAASTITWSNVPGVSSQSAALALKALANLLYYSKNIAGSTTTT